MELIQHKVSKGINAYLIPTKKFKTVTISCCIQRDLDEQYSGNALVPAVLKRGSEEYRNMIEIEKFLEDQYGGLFNTGVQKKGERHILRFSMDILNEKFTNDSNLYEKGLSFLSDIINNPYLEMGLFKKEYFIQERENLINLVKSLKNDKMRYSFQQCIKHMCKDEKYSRYEYGSIDDLVKLENKKLYSIYKEASLNSPMDIFILGNVEEKRIFDIVDDYFKVDRSYSESIPLTIVKSIKKEPKTIIEEMQISQAKLNIGYRTNISVKDESYPSLVVLNSILGGGAHSKLFMNVREKESLAYYASSTILKFKGLLMIYAGIDATQFEKTVDIIGEQVKSIQNGNIKPTEIESAKYAIITSLRSVMDVPSRVIDHYIGNIVSNTDTSIEELIEKVEKVEVKDVVKAAMKLKLDTIYLLRGKERKAV